MLVGELEKVILLQVFFYFQDITLFLTVKKSSRVPSSSDPGIKDLWCGAERVLLFNHTSLYFNHTQIWWWYIAAEMLNATLSLPPLSLSSCHSVLSRSSQRKWIVSEDKVSPTCGLEKKFPPLFLWDSQASLCLGFSVLGSNALVLTCSLWFGSKKKKWMGTSLNIKWSTVCLLFPVVWLVIITSQFLMICWVACLKTTYYIICSNCLSVFNPVKMGSRHRQRESGS